MAACSAHRLGENAGHRRAGGEAPNRRCGRVALLALHGDQGEISECLPAFGREQRFDPRRLLAACCVAAGAKDFG
jgi:hypothetical protein